MRRKKKRLPQRVFERAVRITNGTYEPKVERKLKNSVRPETKVDWIDDELKFLEIEEKLKRQLGLD